MLTSLNNITTTSPESTTSINQPTLRIMGRKLTIVPPTPIPAATFSSSIITNEGEIPATGSFSFAVNQGLRASNDHLSAKVNKLESENKHIREQLEERNIEYRNLQSTFDDLQEKYTTLKNSDTFERERDLTAQLEQLKEENRTVYNQLHVERQEKKTLLIDQANLQTLVDDIKSQYMRIQKCYNALKSNSDYLANQVSLFITKTLSSQNNPDVHMQLNGALPLTPNFVTLEPNT